MNTRKKELAHEIQKELVQLWDEVEEFGKREKNIGVSLHELQKEAIAIGAEDIVQATRQAFIRMNQAGVLLVQLHMDINVPPTAFKPLE